MRRLLLTIAILSLAGVAVSAYALSQHYAPLGSAFCNLGETFSCDLVNKSAFSEVFGIPVAGIGVAGYAALFALALGALFDKSLSPPPQGIGVSSSSEISNLKSMVRGRRIRGPLALLLILSLLGLLFSAYLTYIEFFVIGAVCILCVTSQALILAITGVGYVGWRWQRRATRL